MFECLAVILYMEETGMDAFADLRIKFDNMTTVEKGQFCANIEKAVASSNNPVQKQFLDECVNKLNFELQGSQQVAPPSQTDIPQQTEAPLQMERATPTEVALQAGSGDALKSTKKTAVKGVKSWLSAITANLNSMAGESGSVDIRLRDLFSGVFKKHSRSESDEIFIAGTVHTTPDESEIVVSWPRPWLFSRVLLALLVTFVLLYICSLQFNNPNILPGLMFIGALAVPFSVLIFVFETNAPRNISIFEVIKMFFVGGASSLVLTLILFEIIPVGDMGYVGALTVGFIEEVGKLLAIVLFVRLLNPRYILNGMLIGAAIGAGFAVFETAGYGFRFFVYSGFQFDVLIDVLFLRAWSSIGAHVAWASITGAALVLVKGETPFKPGCIFNVKFLRFLVIPIVLHGTWNSPLLAGSAITLNLKMCVLIVCAWIVIFVLLNAGLKQIERVCAGLPLRLTD